MQESIAERAASRRQFLQLGSSAGLALVSDGLFQPLAAIASDALAKPRTPRRIYTSVKWGMINSGANALEKFQLCKELGFDGMELVSPADGFTIDEAVAASRATDMPIHGVVDAQHWDIRLSSPDESVRKRGAAILEQAIADTNALGGSAVLLVPGKVTGPNETHDDVWQRSIPAIRGVLPTASRLGVRVLIEPVWNGFCEQPEQLRDYIDDVGSPWVGCYFDLGNMVKFAPSEEWLRTLGHRVVKLDVKDWSEAGGFGKMGDGAVNWPEVRRALDEIGFTGWCTAEVAGGGRDELADVAARMARVLALPPAS